MAKIAVKAESTCSAACGRPAGRLLASSRGWNVFEMVCNAGPRDRSFDEQHSEFTVALVTGGTFQYRCSSGGELMTPGSFLLGNPGQYFECGHEHGTGDRCISFRYRPEYFDAILSEAGTPGLTAFKTIRVPPLRELSNVVARACALKAAASSSAEQWEEVSLELAARALELGNGISAAKTNSPSAEARVTRAVRMIESRPAGNYDLSDLAGEARLSRYHFLRMFQKLTGLTPHRYILRTRLRRAAARLLADPAQVLEIALDCGFGDVSNFNHAFLAEFEVSPRKYRKRPFAFPHPQP